MGGAIGLLLGGALTEALDWRWCLYVSIVFAAPAALAATRLLQRLADAHGQVIERLLQAKVGMLDSELAAYLGSRHTESVRGVHGLLQRVLNAAESQGIQPTAALAREVLEGSTAKPPRRPALPRTSGVVAPAGGVRSRE
jgi:MFS family permease